VRHNVTHFVRVRSCCAHPILRVAHFTRGDHFHRLGDFLRIFNASNLGPDFFASGH
jgi:hypothetical protein